MKKIVLLMGLTLIAPAPVTAATRVTLSGIVDIASDPRGVFRGAVDGDAFLASFIQPGPGLSDPGMWEQLTINGAPIDLSAFPFEYPGYARLLTYTSSDGARRSFLDVFYQRGDAGILDVDGELRVEFSFIDLPPVEGPPATLFLPPDFGGYVQYWHANYAPGGNDVLSRDDGSARLIVKTLVVADVPEPATWATIVSGFGLMGGAIRRRQRISVRFT